MTGNVFDIQRFSIHDGNGIRTNVFLKGCNLACKWCHNPESQKNKPELMFFASKCVGCGKCTNICNNTFKSNCIACGKCVDVCEHHARSIVGKNMTVDEVFDVVIKDKEYYITSGGGITISGGEPLLQPAFVKELLVRCKENDIDTAIETAGNVDDKVFEEIIPYVDTFLYDIKAINEKVHIDCCGVSNTKILENASKLKIIAKNILFRMPYVPNYNAKELTKIKEFVGDFPLEILAYHKIGESKYGAINKNCPTSDVVPPTIEEMKALAKKYGVIYKETGL